MLQCSHLIHRCTRRLRSGATGEQALLALAGEACTPAISNRLDSFYVSPQIGEMGLAEDRYNDERSARQG